MKSIFKSTALTVLSAAIALAQTSRPLRPVPTRAPAVIPAVITDRRIYSEGQPSALPRAGGTFVDPAFGTTIMRVTDETDGTSCHNYYSYWPTFNVDSTRFFIACDNNPKLYGFDPDDFRLLRKGPLFERRVPGSGYLSAEDAIWSGTKSSMLFGHIDQKLYAYDIVAREYSLIKDFSGQLTTGFLAQMSKSLDDNVFAFTRKDKDYKALGYIVWQRDQDKVLGYADVPNLDEVQVDKTGRYLVIKAKFDRTVDVQVVDLQTRKVDNLTDPSPDFSPGHSDNGRLIIVGHDNWNNQFTMRKLAAPHQFQTVVGFGSDWSQASHVSMLADNEDWCVISNYTAGSGGAGPFRNEIFQASTDGSQRVRRLAHHRSVYRDYWDTPRADVSRDGRFIAFTSNWGGDRRDVFIIKVPPIAP